MLTGIAIIAGIGLIICLYGLYIERKAQANHAYKAACDISDQVSCTKTFLSPWGKMLGISNLYVGIAFYVGMIVVGFLDLHYLAFFGAAAACAASVFLAYILYAKVKTFCLLCSSIYVVNIILLVIAYRGL
jgi:vitamin-K-epoxide reductase (warfarin-sensitive)